MARSPAPDLPLVVAGPIVRRVEPHAAAVFVALRAPRVVELTVHRPGTAAFVRAGVRETVALGPHLHVVVVTADTGEALEWGETYEYDLGFTAPDGARRWLGDDGVLVPRVATAALVDRLVYRDADRPRFTLLPADPGRWRVLHGSCRKLHGAGDDALAHADTLLADAIAQHVTPPQLLCLTGDQIYADDVHTSLLPALRVYASDDIDDAEERTELASLGAALAPGRRQATLESRAGLTAESMSSHLVGFAEFAAMYVFAWSPQPWAVFDAIPSDLERSHAVLPAVRRALANVSTMMICDDHEISDDWNLRRGWYQRVMNRDLGRRVVRNGLLAYAIFQHWGNDPAGFARDTPGGALLAAVDGGMIGATAVHPATIAVEACLGLVADAADLARPRADALAYTWRLDTPAASVIALDCRMCRGFPDDDTVDLMSPAAIDAALPEGEEAPLTVLVSPAPVLGFELLERLKGFFGGVGDLDAFLDCEAWADSPAQKHLVERLVARGPAVVLSGDVHYGFAATLAVTGGRHAGRTVVNLVASALKNRSDGFARLVHLSDWFSGSRGGVVEQREHAALRAALSGEAPITAVVALPGDTLDGGLYREEIVGLDALAAAPLDPMTPLDLRGLDSHDRERWPLTAWNHLCELRLLPAAGAIEHSTWWVDRRGGFELRVDRVDFRFEG